MDWYFNGSQSILWEHLEAHIVLLWQSASVYSTLDVLVSVIEVSTRF